MTSVIFYTKFGFIIEMYQDWQGIYITVQKYGVNFWEKKKSIILTKAAYLFDKQTVKLWNIITI